MGKARTFDPMIDDDLQRDIVDAYVQIRDDEKRGDVDSRKSYTTPRTLLAILRLSQAHARCRFSTRVERQDFDEAMRLTKASKESVELSAPAKKDQNPLDLVYDLLSDMVKSSSMDDGWVDMTHLVSMAGHKALCHHGAHNLGCIFDYFAEVLGKNFRYHTRLDGFHGIALTTTSQDFGHD